VCQVIISPFFISNPQYTPPWGVMDIIVISVTREQHGKIMSTKIISTIICYISLLLTLFLVTMVPITTFLFCYKLINHIVFE